MYVDMYPNVYKINAHELWRILYAYVYVERSTLPRISNTKS